MTVASPTGDDPAVPSDSRALVLVVLLAAVLVVHLPAFVCMGPHYDVVQWDLDARAVITGEVLYRDVLENNLPGMLVFQAPLRLLLGWRSEVIRGADVVVVGLCIWLLAGRVPGSAAAKLGTTLVLTSFYLSTTEWCHAQRDSWMLLPALLALSLRRSACAEGFLWGVAVWVKPYAVVPAFACWLVSVALRRRVDSAPWARILLDAAGLLLGGLLAGSLGLAWLWATGAWADFWDILLVWNREYVRFDTTDGAGPLAWLGLAVRFFPWILAHLVAVPLALAHLWGLARSNTDRDSVLLSALYLGWLAQAVFLQHLFDYPHVPPLLLALALICREIARPSAVQSWALLTIFLVFCMLFRLAPLTADRLPAVADCLRYGSTPAMRDQLSLLRRVDWQALAEVRDYLRTNGIQDGELSCLNMGAAVLYLDLDLRPATRFVVLQNNLAVFARQRPRIFDELGRSGQRYLVVDVEIALWQAKPPPPADGRVVFEAGRYRVYALTGEETQAWVRDHLALPSAN